MWPSIRSCIGVSSQLSLPRPYLPTERGINDRHNHPVTAYCSKVWQRAASALRRGLFHGTCERLLFVLISVDMVDLHARPLPQQRPNPGSDLCIPTAPNRGSLPCRRNYPADNMRARTVGAPPCRSAGTIQHGRSVSARKPSKAVRSSCASCGRSVMGAVRIAPHSAGRTARISPRATSPQPSTISSTKSATFSPFHRRPTGRNRRWPWPRRRSTRSATRGCKWISRCSVRFPIRSFSSRSAGRSSCSADTGSCRRRARCPSSLFFGALAVATGVHLILDLSSPYLGVFRASPAPLEQVLDHMSKGQGTVGGS